MKAKEYFEKYKNEFLSSEGDFIKALNAMYLELLHEVDSICDMRNITLMKGQIAVLKEQNQKANAIANMFDFPVLKRDYFKKLFLSSNEQFIPFWK